MALCVDRVLLLLAPSTSGLPVLLLASGVVRGRWSFLASEFVRANGLVMEKPDGAWARCAGSGVWVFPLTLARLHTPARGIACELAHEMK